MNTNQKTAVILSIILTTSIFLAIAKNQNQFSHTAVFQDDFEAFSKNWFTDTREGSVTQSSKVKLEGSYSLQIYSPDWDTNAYAYTSIPEIINKDFHIQIWFYIDYSVPPYHFYIAECRDSNEKVQNRIVVNDESGVCHVAILLKGNGYDPINYQNICIISRNDWHKLDLYWRFSSVYDVYVDDNFYGSYQPRDSNIIVDSFYLGDSTVGGFRGLAYFDDLTIEVLK
jgi:hypothetical protein